MAFQLRNLYSKGKHFGNHSACFPKSASTHPRFATSGCQLWLWGMVPTSTFCGLRVYCGSTTHTFQEGSCVAKAFLSATQNGRKPLKLKVPSWIAESWCHGKVFVGVQTNSSDFSEQLSHSSSRRARPRRRKRGDLWQVFTSQITDLKFHCRTEMLELNSNIYSFLKVACVPL